MKSKYIPDDKYESVRDGIKHRKELQKQLKQMPAVQSPAAVKYEMNVMTGDALRTLIGSAGDLEKRKCISGIRTYLYGRVTPRVCSVYGLRRTGKTTMLYQLMDEMNTENYAKTAYIKARKNQTMTMLDRDMKKLYENDYRFIFLDEITFLEDFVDTASFLSDIYAAMGMKIVLSGTDSLGLWFAAHEELYDRTYTIHTTWIPYAEHARLLGIDDIDEYIRYGGTLRAGETDFDDDELRSEEVSFRDDETARRYIDTAICKNIQHSLRCYESGSHFRRLQKLHDANELTGAINRIIEDMNHRFVLEVLNQDFISGDLKLSAKNLLREKNPKLRTDVLDRIDAGAVTEQLMEILKIQNKSDRSVPVTDAHIYEIKEYLSALELISSYPVRYDEPGKSKDESILFIQPGMRYCQAQALVFSLKKDAVFAGLNAAEKEYICGRILDEIKSRMMEEIVLFETMKILGDRYEVFKLRFAVGEFDMVIYSKEENRCAIYEIKHSKEAVSNQYRHLTEEEKLRKTEQKFGEIVSRQVLYRGIPLETEDGIVYTNTEEYLKSISESVAQAFEGSMNENEEPEITM